MSSPLLPRKASRIGVREIELVDGPVLEVVAPDHRPVRDDLLADEEGLSEQRRRGHLPEVRLDVRLPHVLGGVEPEAVDAHLHEG